MSADLVVKVGLWLLALAFNAGMFYMVVRQMRREAADLRRDVNGVGGRVRRLEKNGLIALLIVLEKREDREVVGNLSREP